MQGSTLVERFGDDDGAISQTLGCEPTADDSIPNLAYRFKMSERIYIAMSAKSRRKELRRGQCLPSDGGGIERFLSPLNCNASQSHVSQAVPMKISRSHDSG